MGKIQLASGHTPNNFEEIKEASTKHFGTLYSQENEEEYDESMQEMLEHIPRKISNEEKNPCSRKFEEEIIQAIWGLEQYKAPKPNGFSIHFFKSFWEMIKFQLKNNAQINFEEEKSWWFHELNTSGSHPQGSESIYLFKISTNFSM
jgi:hypothetical protein